MSRCTLCHLVYRNNGKVAVQYGPIVYCAESVDNGDNLHALFINIHEEIEVKYNEEFGFNVLRAKGKRKLFSEMLYEPVSNHFETTDINLIPYSCFANRGKSDMLVWINIG